AGLRPARRRPSAGRSARAPRDVVTPGELGEQLGHREAVGGDIAHVVHLGVRRAVERGEVAAEHDVAVAAPRRHAGPLVADEDHAAPVLVSAIDLPPEPPPFLIGDLEIVRLWHIMSSSAISRPKAKYSSIVPVPTVARVWPCRSPHQVFDSPAPRARITLDSARYDPDAAVIRVSAPAVAL